MDSSVSSADSCSSEMQRYERLEKLGEGTYGVVYKARDRVDGAFVAVKKIRLERAEEGVPSTAMREMAILKTTRHPRVVALRDVVYEPLRKRLCLVFEFVEMDLKKFLRARADSLSAAEVRALALQMLEGVAACHARRVIHRDLKPQNLLVDPRTGSLKLADFGLARAFTLPMRSLTHEVETLWYRAPEILMGQRAYGLGVDVWAAGCVFAELHERRPLFAGDCEIDQLFRIFRLFGTPSEATWPGIAALPDFRSSFPRWTPADPTTVFSTLRGAALDLFLQMMIMDPRKRITAHQALLHPYFTQHLD